MDYQHNNIFPLLRSILGQSLIISKIRQKIVLAIVLNRKNSEVKVSLGGATHSKFNFVQIRPSHDCDTYILTAYHLYLLKMLR
jgi:hypothetical protein